MNDEILTEPQGHCVYIPSFPDVGLRRTCAENRTSARAMCVRKCVRKGFWNCACDVCACGWFLGVRCAIALLHTFLNKRTRFLPCSFTGSKPIIYLHILAVSNILCQKKTWFAFSRIGFCASTKFFEEALNAVKFLDWLKIFGPTQNILGPVKG